MHYNGMDISVSTATVCLFLGAYRKTRERASYILSHEKHHNCPTLPNLEPRTTKKTIKAIR